MALECIAPLRQLWRQRETLAGSGDPMTGLIQLTESDTRPSAHGFALFNKGFRTFFALASLHAALLVPVWVVAVTGVVPVPEIGMSWHAHEMLFGFTLAVIAGFLLTAVTNWTGRETARGGNLAALGLIWLAGRVAPFVLSPRWAAVVDLAFIPLLLVALARAIIPAGNRRNYVFLGLLTLLEVLSFLHHSGTLGVFSGWERKADLLAADVIAIIICIMTARVLPMFTKNATGFEVQRSQVAERAAVVGLGCLLVLSGLEAPGWLLQVAASLTAGALLLRSWRWGFRASFGTPLLWILHLGNLWLTVSVALRGFPGVMSTPLALHAFTVGCVAMLCLGMMARVSLGHTGRMLVPSGMVEVSFWLLLVAGVARVIAPAFFPAFYRGQLLVAAVAWTLAFGSFFVASLPIWVRPRVDGKPG
ncbi:MAG: NnrS family protein [Polyangiaceae bacterium]